MIFFNPYFFQVCFKHPDLLKQAREACVAKKEEGNKLKRKSTTTSTNEIKPAKVMHNKQLSNPLPHKNCLPKKLNFYIEFGGLCVCFKKNKKK